MKLDSLLTALLTAARIGAPTDRVPYAFEQRVMARIREVRPADALAAWTAGLWRAAFPSLAVAALLMGANAVVSDGPSESPASLEVVLVSAADPTPDLW